MTYEAIQIMSRRGTEFALDRRRRDALATYAENHAADAGKPPQTWVRETWGFKVYEAKHLLAGNASEVMWERILKGRGPHTGWAVAIPVLGAVIGEDIAFHFAAERQQVAHERARYAAEEARIARLEESARERRSFLREPPGAASLPDGRAAGERRVAASGVGREID
jgi:hypothetical protein